MAWKTTRALTAPDGTIYANRGAVLPEDDPIALAHPNAVVGHPDEEVEGAAAHEPEPELVEDPRGHDSLDEQFLIELEDELEGLEEGGAEI